MSYYSDRPVNSEDLARETGSRVYSLGTGASHERLIQQSGGEIGYDGFKDPRPNEEGNIKADRVFINEQTQTIQGINFSKNGQFCCSYTGYDYNDIKDSNRRDCENKKEQSKDTQQQTDEFGIDLSKSTIISSERSRWTDKHR